MEGQGRERSNSLENTEMGQYDRYGSGPCLARSEQGLVGRTELEEAETE